MRRIIRWVSVLILPIGIGMFLKQYFTMDVDLQGAVTKTVASMLGMIPEGLILLTSVSLAAGVVKLGGSNALVNELFGIETLARTDVVCMDKTGTLTSGEMTLEETLPLNGASQDEIAACLGALLGAFSDETTTTRALVAAYPIGGEKPAAAVPFSSARKWSAGYWKSLGTVALGAPERLACGEALEMGAGAGGPGGGACSCWRAPRKRWTAKRCRAGLFPWRCCACGIRSGRMYKKPCNTLASKM